MVVGWLRMNWARGVRNLLKRRRESSKSSRRKSEATSGSQKKVVVRLGVACEKQSLPGVSRADKGRAAAKPEDRITGETGVAGCLGRDAGPRQCRGPRSLSSSVVVPRAEIT